MIVEESTEPLIIDWETKVQGDKWFAARFNLEDMTFSRATDHSTAKFLMALIKEAVQLQPLLITARTGHRIFSELEFDIRWGLGSSSSLISNLAYWLNIDPYKYFRRVMPGSGYDVFCARAEQPIFFRLDGDTPLVEVAAFDPDFKDQLHFVYLGNKQDSQDSVRRFRSGQARDEKVILEISVLTKAMAGAATLQDFCQTIRWHEEIMASALQQPRVKTALFPDFDGEIKSLGAWGGDFILAASAMPGEKVREYFAEKNRNIIFGYGALVC